ncbi:hypothetical protein N8328_05355 [Crocinitomicaceae bacterium]|nr:hypothetical protein [Crocinitomicaceae bacterium]
MNEIDNIKDPRYILDQKPNETGGQDYVLKNGIKLGQAFHFLPAGIINKKETGIGATTLEIDAPRNSIIIEPLKITVIEKEKQERKKEQSGYKLFAFLIEDKGIFKKLRAYLEDPSIKYKKIILVIDNLEKLILHLGDAFIDYFFLFDEIDYMQSGSSYRDMIEYGIDLGKVHKQFAVVSATLMQFSDPDLLKLPVTNYSYEYLEKKEVKIDFYKAHNLFKTEFSSESALQKSKLVKKKLASYIVEILKATDDKMMVAINSVAAIVEISDFLVKKEYIKNEDITLLISDKADNKPIMEKYSNKKIEEEKLPTRLNFITSAYFNGYDLKDEYRLLIFSSPPIGPKMLSINEIKQIYGRNRIDGIIEFVLFSHDMESKDAENPEFMELTQNDFLEMASSHVEMAFCMEKHFKDKIKEDDKIQKVFKDSFTNSFFKDPLNFSRLKKQLDIKDLIGSLNNPEKIFYSFDIAHFKVDYFYHIQSVQKNNYLRSSKKVELVGLSLFERHSNNALLSSLKELGFEFVFPSFDYDLVDLYEDNLSQGDKIKIILFEVQEYYKLNKKKNPNWSSQHLAIFKLLTEGQKTFTLKSVSEEIGKLNSFKSITGLSTFIAAHEANNQHVLVREIKYHFKIGSIYSSGQIQEIVTKIFENLNRKNPPKSFSAAKTYLHLCYSLGAITKRDNKDKVSNQYKVKKGSPYLLKHKKNRKK